MAKASKKITTQTDPRRGRRTSKTSGPGADELAKIALDLFAERHFASVTIKDIGRAANVNSAMIYYHYKDKEDLFRAAIESAVDEAFLLYAKHCNGKVHANAAEAIGAWFDVHVTLHRQLRNVVKISLDCKGVVGTVPEADDPIKRFYDHESEIIQGIIRDGIKTGIFREVDPAIVATMISTTLDGVMARSFILRDFDMPATVEEFKEALWLYLGYVPSNPGAGQSAKDSRANRKSRARR